MDKLADLNLLFLEDNKEFAKNTTELLNIYFNKIFYCQNIVDSLIAFNDNRIDVIISDIKLNRENGLEFITKIRKIDNTIPIIVLSAHKDEEFLFKAIPLNITSYELKPLRYDDFMLLLKKISDIFDNKDEYTLQNELIYNFKTRELSLEYKLIKLTKKETLFIELLAKNSTKLIDNETVQKAIWENSVMSDAAIKNFIYRLRKKVGVDFIDCISGLGYRLSYKLS